ncbi:DUF6356 family protein [Sandaracinobacteroides saxicola]|uniref:DUF6356 family protein n=1 Tax=Sandaracinobacteroides saxicola TaxID=2759707 RepID=UPI001A9C43C5|nr:DUF6356 family protein [Sandaracinobacteroides saxicola]
MLRTLFIDHPRDVGESYAEHAAVAAGFGWALARASAACFVHALIPGLCRTTGSRAITALHARMVTNRRAAPAETAAEDAALLWMAANI